MIRIIFTSLKLKLGRFLLTLKGILNLSLGSNSFLEIPFNIRGKGKIIIAENVKVLKNAFLFVDGKLSIGKSSILEENCMIKISKDASISMGIGSTIGKNSRVKADIGNWEIGNNVNISPDAMIFSRESGYYGCLTVGNNTNFSDGVVLDLSQDINIGNNVALGHGVTIFTHNHEYTDPEKAAWKGGVISKAVNIKDDCWIGANVTIMPGVTIGKRAIVATGAVVTKDISDNQMFAGVPAKCIKDKVI